MPDSVLLITLCCGTLLRDLVLRAGGSMVDNLEHALEGNDTIDYRAERMALLRLRRRLLKVWRSEETPPASRVTEAAIRGIEGLVCLLEELGEREASASRSG